MLTLRKDAPPGLDFPIFPHGIALQPLILNHLLCNPPGKSDRIDKRRDHTWQSHDLPIKKGRGGL